MSVTKVRTAPKSLPRAQLYLDDVVEIQTIISDVMRFSDVRSTVNAGQEGTPQISFEYVLDESIRISTIEELSAQGGYAKEFSLEATRSGDPGRFCSLDVRPRWASLYVSSLYSSLNGLEDKSFELHARISKVFEDRQLPLRVFLDAVPSLTAFSLPVAVFAVGFFVIGVLFGFSHYRVLITVGSGCIALAAMAITYLDQKKSRVYLTPHRQDTLAKKERTKERWEKFLWLVAGAILGSIVTIISGHFKK